MDIDNLKGRICLALDVEDLSYAVEITKKLNPYIGLYKIGKQLFTKEGAGSIRAIRACGADVFLDLKYHDIPNTVALAAREAVRLGVKIFNVHAFGGSEMVKAACEAAYDESQRLGVNTPTVLAVTVLTSINNDVLSCELCVKLDAESMVVHLAKLARAAGAHGVVASAREISHIKKACGDDFVVLTPGIRPAWASKNDDQKRILTPKEAINIGADYIVIGRPILQAENMLEAARDVYLEVTGGVKNCY